MVFKSRLLLSIAIGTAMVTSPAAAFCVRNDTGSPVVVEALEGTAIFRTELANNKKACCAPKDEACGIEKGKIRLSISSEGEGAQCTVEVSPKGSVNVTGRSDQLRCKANKAGSTMDWVSG